MGFRAGEDLYYGMFAKAVDLFPGDEIVWVDDLGLCSTLSGKGLDLRD
jgi:hypothetical protein